MANPFSEERRQQLQDDAIDFLTTFSKEYLKMYAVAMLERFQKEVEGEPADPRKLTYRDWNSVQRPQLFSGACYMKKGAGPGTFGKWKNVFLAERQDFNLDVYPDEKAKEAGKKPSDTIQMAGYGVARDTAWHYKWEMRHVAAGIGLTEAETEVMCNFSTYSVALTHGQRPNYIIQLHKSKDPVFPCCGGNTVEPDDAGSEFAKERETLLDCLSRCVSRVSARDTDCLSGMAFDKTCGKMKSSLCNLHHWDDDGTEAQLLVDMLMEQCLPGIRDGVLSDLVGPASIKLAVWYKTRGVIHSVLTKLANPAWLKMQEGAEKVGRKVEPKIKQGVKPVLELKQKLKNAIQAKVSDKMGEFLAKYVSPFIKPILQAFDRPMTKAFQQARITYETRVDLGRLPGDVAQRNLQLDNIPRTWDNVYDMGQAAHELVEPIKSLKSLSGDVFSDVDPYELKTQAEQTLLETLDAAVYTTQIRLDGQATNIKENILQGYDHDVVLARAAFMTDVVKGLLIAAFKRAISPVSDPVLELVDGNIPEDLQDFISLAAIFDEMVDLFVGGPIVHMVERAYPKPR